MGIEHTCENWKEILAESNMSLPSESNGIKDTEHTIKIITLVKGNYMKMAPEINRTIDKTIEEE